MSDSIESAISSSIASLPGSEASLSGSGGGESNDTGESTAVDTGDSGESVVPGSGDGAVATGDGTVQTPAVAATDAVAVTSPADDSLDGLKAELAGKRDNRIPYSRVTKIVANAEKAAEAKVRAEVEAEVAPYRTVEFKNERAAARLADENPERYLQALAQVDPRYAELLQGAKVLGSAAPARGAKPQQQAQGGAAARAVADVEPDIQLADGTLGFSAEATMRREAALKEAVREEMRELFDSTITERLKDVEPIVKERRVNALRAEAAERVSGRIAAAEKNWPGFGESKAAIGAYIDAATKRGEQVSLHDAYIAVVMPKYRTDEATMRAKIHAEMNKAASATSRVAPGAGVNKDEQAAASDDDPITAAIRSSIRR
jgi:predicted nucleic acid-binding protein